MRQLVILDVPVYDIENNILLSSGLCPFSMSADKQSAFDTWMRNRYYLKANRTAERIVEQAGGVNSFRAKRRLSLSDSFWIRHDEDEVVRFETITPYKNKFSLLGINAGVVQSNSIPELVLGGSQPKQWHIGADKITYMSKAEQSEQIHAEMLAVKLARYSDIKSMNAFVAAKSGKVYARNYDVTAIDEDLGLINLVNMTSIERSLIQFDQLGISVDGTNPKRVAEAYKTAGVSIDALDIALKQVLFDTVVGNTDRRNNNSNWGIFFDNQTGERTPSWMYDFNWASLQILNQPMIAEVITHVKHDGLESRACRILEPLRDMCKTLLLETWERNASLMLDYLVKKT